MEQLVSEITDLRAEVTALRREKRNSYSFSEAVPYPEEIDNLPATTMEQISKLEKRLSEPSFESSFVSINMGVFSIFHNRLLFF